MSKHERYRKAHSLGELEYLSLLRTHVRVYLLMLNTYGNVYLFLDRLDVEFTRETCRNTQLDMRDGACFLIHMDG